MKDLLQGARWAAVSLLWILPRPALAVDRVTITVAAVSAPQGALAGGRAVFRLIPSGLQLEARASTLRVREAGVPVLSRVTLSCRSLIVGTTVACRGGQLSGLAGADGRIGAELSAAFDPVGDAVRFSASNVTLAGGAARLDGTLQRGAWSLRAEAAGIDLARAVRLARPWLTVPAGDTVSGRVDARIALTDRPTLTAGLSARIADLNLSNAPGTVAAQQVSAAVSGTALRRGAVITVGVTAIGSRGQALAGPVFMDFGAHPLTLRAQFTRTGTGPVTVSRLAVAQRGVIAASAHGTLQLGRRPLVERAAVRVSRLQFPGAFTTFMQMSLASSALASLKSSGEASGAAQIADDAVVRFDGALRDIDFDDPVARLDVRRANGDIHWAAASGASVAASRLSWRRFGAYGLSGGAAALSFLAWGRNFALLGGNVRLPIFNGAVIVHTLVGRNLGTADAKLDFDADLTPISMPQLSRAFGWPVMNGELSGHIPLVRYRGHELTFDGNLVARVFDGSITGRDIRLENPLGQWPQLTADVQARGLDLDLVTRTFAIGSMTGRIDADITGLRLFGWSPVAFDARLYTVPGDRSAHRISQKAVTRIAALGGGAGAVTAALESGVLRFFKTFHYRRIAIGCRLRNEVCLMSGAGPAPGGGYYLVQGSWVPRLDIIGNVRRVDWPRMLAQIRQGIEDHGVSVR